MILVDDTNVHVLGYNYQNDTPYSQWHVHSLSRPLFPVRKCLAVAKNQLSAGFVSGPEYHLRLMHRIAKVIIYFNEQIRNYSEVSDAEISILSIQTQTIGFYCVLSLSIDKVPNIVLGLSAYIIIAMIN